MSDQKRTADSVSAVQNEIKTYNLKDTITWLREIIGPDGIGEHVSVEQKQAARTILAIMPDDNECEHEVDRSTGQCIYCTTTIDVPDSRSSDASARLGPSCCFRRVCDGPTCDCDCHGQRTNDAPAEGK